MALREFKPGQEEAEGGVNSYLNEIWGIKSYKQIAPVALLQQDARSKVFPGNISAYPLLLKEGSSDSRWEAVAVGEDESLISVVGLFGETAKLYIVIFQNVRPGDWSFIGDRSEINKEEETYYGEKELFLDRDFGQNIRNYMVDVHLLRDEEDADLDYYGELHNEKSEQTMRLYLASFWKRQLDLGSYQELDTAKWLKKVVGSSLVHPGNFHALR